MKINSKPIFLILMFVALIMSEGQELLAQEGMGTTKRSAPSQKKKSLNSKEIRKKKVADRNIKPVSSGKSKGQKKLSAQQGVITTDGAAVYVAPDFDSRPVTFLEQGKKVTMSKKTFPGKGGIGIFYKARMTKSSLGYIADVDVVPQFKAGDKSGKKMEENPDFEEPFEEDKGEEEPLYFRKWIGGTVGQLGYGEKFQGKEYFANTIVYGFKLTGPDIILAPPLDWSVYFSFQVPDYYSKLDARGAKGLFVVTDLVLPIPIIDWGKANLTLGLGPMLTYTKFSFQIKNSVFDSQEVRLGFVAAGGLSFNVSKKWVVRLEPKYFWEKTKYLGYFGSVQHSF